jgi:hypothetical protein
VFLFSKMSEDSEVKVEGWTQADVLPTRTDKATQDAADVYFNLMKNKHRSLVYLLSVFGVFDGSVIPFALVVCEALR